MPKTKYENYYREVGCPDELFEEMVEWQNSLEDIGYLDDKWMADLPDWMPPYYKTEFKSHLEKLESECFDDALSYLQYLGAQHLYPDRFAYPGYPPDDGEKSEIINALNSVIAIKTIEFGGREKTISLFNTPDTQGAMDLYHSQREQCKKNNEEKANAAKVKKKIIQLRALAIRKEHPTHSKTSIANILMRDFPDCKIDYLRRQVPDKSK